MESGLHADKAVLTWVIYLSRSLPPRLRRKSSTAICKHAFDLRQKYSNLKKAWPDVQIEAGEDKTYGLGEVGIPIHIDDIVISANERADAVETNVLQK